MFLPVMEVCVYVCVHEYCSAIYVHEYCYAADVVKGNETQIHQAVKLWVERYEKDSKLAMVELLTMLFEVIMGVFKISLFGK